MGSRYGGTVDELNDRLAQAVGAHDPDYADVQIIQNAYEGVPDNKRDNVTFEDLRPEVQAAVLRCEALPLTSWEDPLDVPDDTSYMDD